MKRFRPTIYDLEKITGYSIGTISRAFNESSEISAKTREFIRQKAKEVGYAPHPGARAIIHGKSGRLGLLLPHLYNPRYAELMDHLDLEARRESSVLLLGLSRGNAEAEEKLVAHWTSGEVDGIIVDACVDPTVFHQPRQRKFPIVFLFGRPSAQYNVVSQDNVPPILEMLARCVAQGHRRIGYVSPDFSDAKLVGSYVAYQTALKLYGLPQDESLTFFAQHDYEAGFAAWAHWRDRLDRPTAFLCFNDITACGLIQAATVDGKVIPRDFSVMGIDDILMAGYYNLTTVRSDPAHIARASLDLLALPVSRNGVHRQVNSVLVERGSMGPAPVKKTRKRAVLV